MAICASSADAPRASCGNFSDSFHLPVTSRRQFIGGGALAIAAIAAPLAAESAPPRRFDRLLAEYRAADAAVDAFHDREWNPALDRVYADAGSPPSLVYEVPTRGQAPRRFELHPNEAEALALKSDELFGAEHWAAPVAHKYVAWRARAETAEKRHGIEKLEQQEVPLWKRRDEALHRLMREPAPDGAALATKLLVAMESDSSAVDRRFISNLRSDAERLSDSDDVRNEHSN